MTDSRSHRGRGRRIVVLAALGLLAGTAWLLPARIGSPSPAVHARARRQTAHMPPPAAGTPFSATDSELQYSIVLVAYPDTYNNLHKIYSGVTDKYHLDLTPRLELIDAVDADGDRHGELLFREIADGALFTHHRQYYPGGHHPLSQSTET